ncbi:hypothetical protein ACIGNX_08755 [Actinosynnema sp. NPDC053489]|uniref:hypothetical protein n=1 Tax=Actinosynnema sp. NPDC053489 TaxID=3363916 RepID=UPI0037C93044
MDIGEPDRSERHRPEDGAANRLPAGGEPDHTPPDGVASRPAPPPPPDPLVDADGLRKFNIGLVPASVTPPRTWKAAAWFAVLSSAGVLVGLAVAAAHLVGTNGPAERIGLPGYPTGMPLLTGFGTTTPPPATTTTTTTTTRRAPAEAAAHEVVGGERARDGGHPPDRSGPAAPTTPTLVTTVPAQSEPVVDAQAIAANTEAFYEAVAADSRGALSLVTDAFRLASGVLLEREFADVSLIEVREISVDPTRGITVSTLLVTRKDGSTTTEKRQLEFTTGVVPLIDGERSVDGR